MKIFLLGGTDNFRTLKTLFYGKYRKMIFGNTIKKMKGGLFIPKNITTKITSDWYLWIHH